MKFLSDILAKAGLVVDGTVTLNSVANATTDTDRFIVVDSGVVKYRTGTQLLSDIGGISGNQTITLSGDATGSGTTSIAVTLANSGVVAGTYGSSTAVPVITVDAKGRVTGVTTASISGSLTFTGDVTGSGTTGSTTTLTLANSGVTAGTYTKVTVDAKGRVTTGTTLSAGDIPSLNYLPISGGTLTGNLIIWPGTNASYGAGLKFRNDGYAHYTVGVKGNTFVLSNTGADGSVVWSASITDLITVTSAGNVTTLGSVTASSIIKSGGTSSQFLKADGSIDSTTYQSTSQKGQANGYASLDGAGKVPVSQLPSSIMEYKGTWNASTNSPTLADGTGDTGDVYRVSTAGTRNLGSGSITFDIGDYVIYNGTVWEKSDTTDAVASVNGFTGIITLTTTNIGEGTNLYYTDTRARAALSFTAGSGGYNSTTGVITIPTNTNQLTNGAGYITGYTETDTLASVTARGASTNTNVTFNGTITANSSIVQGYGTILTGYNSGFQITVNATYSGGQTNTYTPQYAGVASAGMFVMKQRNGGEGIMDFYGKQSGTDGSTQAYSTFNHLMTMLPTGYVGVGTVAPGAKLDIVSTASGSEGLRVDGASGGFAFVVRGGSTYTSHIRAGLTIGANYFTTPPSNGAIIEGNVGIGLTNPQAILDVSHTAGTTNIIRVSNGSGNYRWRVDQNFSMIMTNSVGTDTFSVTTGGVLTAVSLVKSGGTSSQFLMADGSVSTNPGWITTYTETDTLATVTGRGATTSTPITVTASEGREVSVYMPSSYTTDDLVSGHEYGWYNDHWRLGMTRSSGAAGADFVIQWNAARRLSLTSGGNLSVTGTISATNFSGTHSGSSSGTNTGDQTNISGNAATATNVAWTGVTGKPTTLSGYGITDGVKTNGTLSGNIDSDWGESFTTFDPIPSGTPPLSSPNIRTVNIGSNYARRTQLAFDYASDVAYFRRRQDSTWYTWREFIHSGNIGSQTVATAGALSSMNISQFTNNSGYITSTNSDFTYNASLTLSTSWQNTGVTSANLPAKGTYIVTCYANDYSVGGSQYMCTYVGLMFWYTDGTNSNDTISEIPLHHSGHHDGGRAVFLRTLSSLNADGKTYLQIKGNGNNSGASTYTFTFKRLL